MRLKNIKKLIKESIKEVKSKQLLNEQYYFETEESTVTFSLWQGEYIQIALTGIPNYSLFWNNDPLDASGWNPYQGWDGWFSVPSGAPEFPKWCNSGPPDGPQDVEQCVSQWMWFGPPMWNQDTPLNQCYQPGYPLCQSAVDEGTPIRLFDSEECCCVAAQAAGGFLSSDCMILLYGTDDPSIIWGCTDDIATNYNSEATQDDGSCEYPDLFGLDCATLMNMDLYEPCQQKCESNGYPTNSAWLNQTNADGDPPTCLPFCHCYQEIELFACIDCEVQSIGMFPLGDLTEMYLPWCQGEGIDSYIQWEVDQGCNVFVDFYYQAPSSNGCDDYSQASGYAISNYGNGNNPFLSTYTGNSGIPAYPNACPGAPDPEGIAIPPTKPPNTPPFDLKPEEPIDPQVKRMQNLAGLKDK